MNRIYILFILCNSLNFNLLSQDSISKWEYSLGSGLTILGTGDAYALNIENGISYTINDYFQTSLSLLYGRGVVGKKHFSSSFIEGNYNLYLSPFSYMNKYFLKFGLGLSFRNHNEVSARVSSTENGVFVVHEYRILNSNSFGYNLIIDNQIQLSKLYSAGIRIFGQRYFNNDTNAGILFFIGYKI